MLYPPPNFESSLASPSAGGCICGCHPRRRTLYRFGLRPLVLRRLAVVLLVLLAPMFGAGAARADVLATNLDRLLIYQDGYFLHGVEVSDFSWVGSPVGIAQKFTAGDHGGGYTLSSVAMCLIWISETLSVPKVTIYTADASGNPGTLKYTLINPSSYNQARYGDDFTSCDDGKNTFTAPANATLESETDYFVVFENVGTQATETDTYSDYNIGKVLSGAEGPRASGWSIADTQHEKETPSSSWVAEPLSNTPRPVRIEINGTTLTDTTDPNLDTATVSGRSLVLTYDENLDEDSEPAASDYSVSVGGGIGTAPSSVAVSGKTVTLTLATAVTNGQTVTVDYTKPTSDPVKDKSGNEAEGFTNQSVTNNTPSTNSAPEFSGTSTARSFTETVGNATVQAAADIGAAVAATDTDSDPLTYSLEGTDAGKFTIVSTSGQIRTKVGESYDHEAKTSYSVTVKADDSRGGTDTIVVTISVTNVTTEKPLTPMVPSVSATTGSSTELDVTWTAPANTGRPAITSYDLQYKKASDINWTDGPQNEAATSATIGRLEADTAYQVQVRATNADGDSGWSSEGSGRTNPLPNSAPEFSDTSTTRSFTETVGNATVQTATDIGAAVAATDTDSDPLTYSLEGTDAGKFTIVSTSGQIRTKVGESYDHEAKTSYSVTVKADDSRGDTDTIVVTISVTNVTTEKPLTPAAPSVSAIAGSTMSLSVSWVAPANTGRPAITSYDLQYKKTSDGGWTDGPQNVTGTSTSITGLDGNTPYQVQVRATNDDGDSLWSFAGSGQTDNSAPVFTDGASAARSFTETVGDATVQTAADIGAAVAATDTDSDPLTYSLGGTDAGKFTIVRTSGQIRTKAGESYDHEAKASYDVTVTANDNTATTTIPVTISVTDVDEAPLVPAEAPSVTATMDSTTELDVTWVAPANTGRPAITSYDLQYKKTSDGGWTDGPQNVAATSATIGSLTPETEYQVQVRATNDEGDSLWSSAGRGQTDALPPSLVSASVTISGSHVELVFSRSLSDTFPPASAVTVTVDGLDAEFRDASACGGCPIFLGSPTRISIAVVNRIRRGQSVRVSYTDPTDGDDAEAIQDESGKDAPSFVDQAVENDSTTEPRRPFEPRNLTVTAKSPSEIELSWDPPAYNGGRLVTAYEIEYSTDGVVERPWPHLIENTSNTNTTYNNTSLQEGTTRYYRVLAINSEGTSNSSNSGHATTPTSDGTPSPPRNLKAQAGKLKVDLSWEAPGDEGDSPVTGYKIEVSTDGGNIWADLIGNTRNTNTTYEHTGLLAGVTYHYRVQAINGEGSGVVSAVLAATPPPGPSEPRNLRAVPDDQRITLIWDVPEDDQGLEINGYEYRLSYGGTQEKWNPVTRTRNTINLTDNRSVIPGLQNGQAYEIELRAYNGNGGGVAARVEVTVGRRTVVGGDDDQEGLTFSSSPTFSAAENQTAVGTVAATDNDTATAATGYELTGGVDKDLFAINASGVLTFKAAPDFEAARDAQSTNPANAAGNNEYVVEVTATSGTDTQVKMALQAIAVTVANVDEDPTGEPSIDGAADVGETLTANTGRIGDPDGLRDPPAWSYQWVRVDGMTDTDIGTDSSTYTIVEADRGKRIKVRVSFTDAAGNPEGPLTSAATAVVGMSSQLKAWLARFGRTVADQVLSAVEDRMTAPRQPKMDVSIAGQRIGGAVDSEELEVWEAEALAAWVSGETEEAGVNSFVSRELTGRALLTGSSFALSGGAAGGLGSLWGRGAFSRFNGSEGTLTLDGEVQSTLLGVDWVSGRATAGLAVAHSRGEGGYRSSSGHGEIESTLTGVYPYVRYEPSEWLSVWGVVGYGAGTLTLRSEGMAPIGTDIDLTMVGLGGRGILREAPEGGGFELAAKSDALVVHTSSEAVRGSDASFEALRADAMRFRLGLEGTWRGLEAGGGFVPSFEIGVRRDGGDAETGFGADIGGGLAWMDPSRGIVAQIGVRGLLTHEDGGFREHGFTGSLVWDPSSSSERGPSFTLSQAMGASATGGMDALLGPETARALGAANDDGGDLGRHHMEAKFGYGFAVFDGRFTGTPEIGFGLSNGSRETSLAWRLQEVRRTGLAFGLDAEGVRRESAIGDGGPEHRVGMGLGWRHEGSRREDAALHLRFDGLRSNNARDIRENEYRMGLRMTARW